MLKDYWTIFLRTILRRKLFASIHVVGMAAGLVACFFIALYVLDEYSYDRFHAHADRIYQIGLHSKLGELDVRRASVAPPLADAMLAEIPEVEATLRLNQWLKVVMRFGDKVVIEDKVLFTESNFFEFFSYKLVAGNPATVLKEPNTVVLTETTARKLFGDESPLDKLIVIGDGPDKVSYKVTGVAADCPGNSHLQFKVLLSPGPDSYFKLKEWLNSGVYTYALLRQGASIAVVEKKLEGIVTRHVAPKLQQFLGNTLEQVRAAGGTYAYFGTRITDIHLHSISQEDLEPGGSTTNSNALALIGLFVMAIACINFMNLSTAQSAGRAREVGLRKTLGSLRWQLIGQHLAESALYCFIAVALALVLCYSFLPAFNLLSGKALSLANLLDGKFILVAGLLLVLVALLAGSYPAFYLTSFRPVDVLKGDTSAGRGSKWIRSGLVVFQFAISIFLIIFTSIVYTQISFMQERQLGMDKENVLIIDAYRLGDNVAAFRDALMQQSGISAVSYTANRFPGTYNSFLMRVAGAEGEHRVASYYADYQSKEVLRFEMKEGRYFSNEFPSDSSAVVINEAAAREFGFKKLEGQEILHSPNAFVFLPYHVVGIMRDFNFESYRDKVRPLAIFLDRGPSGIVMARYEGNAREVVEQTAAVWNQFGSGEPFEYSFLDQNFDSVYRSEERMGQVLGLFSVLAVIIACLGLFALAAYTAEQRTREIGIRKVLGASVGSLLFKLTGEFVRLVLIAFVPAALAGWWFTAQWLNGFAYRVEIGVAVFLLAGAGAMVVAWLTVGYHAVKAASANPVKALRHE
ncbi:MAG: ABC transporter permease [Cyclobacteriaceae bacterium]|nr:ABC transporter permease [Cyclobacteriaceae bacterium]